MTSNASSGDAPEPPADAAAAPDTIANDAPGTPSPATTQLQDAAVPAADPGWQHSSHELLTGVEVTDFSESISGEAFHALFHP